MSRARRLAPPFLLVSLLLSTAAFGQERLGAGPPGPAETKAEDLTGGAGPRLGDFRGYVFGAYATVAVLVLLYCFRLHGKQRALSSALASLQQRFSKS